MSKHLQYGSILFVMSIAFAISWQTFTVVNFYTHQEEIEAEYCVNKDKPELNCHGKCHLEKQLNISEFSKEKIPLSSTNSLLVFLAYEDIALCYFCNLSTTENLLFHYDRSLSRGNLSGLLDPPKFS